ncbi:MAG TPA: hypothetical protein VGD94_14945 [Vicinamibacterales bacterium]
MTMATATKALVWMSLAGLLASACGNRNPMSPSSSSLSAGQWTGTTSQGMIITFTVSSDEILRTLSVGHSFNGCSGTQTFSDLQVATAPDVTCVPGPCSGTTSTYRAFSFSSGSRGTGPSTAVNGLFLPGHRAQGVAAFHDFPGCGTLTGVEWTATRR